MVFSRVRPLSAPLRASRSRAIDALRGLAVAAVVVHHASLSPTGLAALDAVFPVLRDWGTLGVDLFFVLSGFCIHSAYTGRSEPFSARQYLLRRWWRIYPPYFFALALAAGLNVLTFAVKSKTGGEYSAGNFGPAPVLSHLLLVHNLHADTFMAVSGPFWTIAVEAQYYLLYLLARPLLARRPGRAVLFAAAAALHFAAWRLRGQGGFQPLEPFQYWLQWLAGAWIAGRLRDARALTPSGRRDGAGFALFAGLLAFAGPLGWTAPGVQTLLAGAAFGFLLLFFLRLERLWSLPGFGWLPALGFISYSVYLVHFLFLERLRVFVLPQAPEGWARLAGLAAATAVSVAAAAVFFGIFERPFLEKAARVPKAAPAA